MSKERWIGADDPSQPVSCPRRLRSEPLVLVAAPADQVGIYPLQVSQQSRPVKVAVVVDPALDVWIVRLGQILQGLVAVVVKRPTPDCPADGRQCFRSGCGQETVRVDVSLP